MTYDVVKGYISGKIRELLKYDRSDNPILVFRARSIIGELQPKEIEIIMTHLSEDGVIQILGREMYEADDKVIYPEYKIKVLKRVYFDKKELSLSAMDTVRLEISFEDSVLVINGKSILLRPDTTEAQLCEIIFSTSEWKEREWAMDEIAESMGDHDPTENQIKDRGDQVSGVVRRLNVKILTATGIENLIVRSSKFVKINKEFLQ